MPADGHGLLSGQAHEAGDDVHRLLPVAVGELVLKEEGGYLLPLACGVVFYIAGACLVATNFAQVVEQGHDGHRLHGVVQLVHVPGAGPGQVVLQAAEHIHRVLAQPTHIGAVEAGGGGGGEKVALI